MRSLAILAPNEALLLLESMNVSLVTSIPEGKPLKLRAAIVGAVFLSNHAEALARHLLPGATVVLRDGGVIDPVPAIAKPKTKTKAAEAETIPPDEQAPE